MRKNEDLKDEISKLQSKIKLIELNIKFSSEENERRMN